MLFASLTFPLAAQILIRQWDASSSTAWATANNWTAANIPNLNTEIAAFSSTWATTTRSPTIAATSYTIGGILVQSTVPNTNINLTGTTGVLTINAGAIDGTAGAGGVGIDNQSTFAETISARMAISNSQTWQASNATSGSLTFSNTTAAIALGANTLTLSSVNSVNSIAVSGPITGAGGNIIVDGAGTVTFSGANTYAGSTTINNGTLAIGANSPLPATTNVTVNATTAGTTALLSLTGANSDTIAGLTFGGTGGTSTSTNNVSTGTGTLTLGGNVTYDATGNPLGSTLSGNLSLGTANRTFTIGDSSNAANDLTVSAVISGAGRSIIKAGAGTMVLSGANTYTGTTTINQGILQAGASNVLPTTAVTINATTAGATALLDLNNFSDTIGALTFGGTGGTSTSTNNVQTGTGTLTLGGNVTYDATGNPLGSTLSGNLSLGAANRTFTIGDSSNAADDLTVLAVVSGAGRSIIKAGAGTLVLSGANTYSGTTTINAGTLIAANNSAFGNTAGNNTVSAGATLGVQGNITLNATEGVSITGTGAAGRSGAVDNISGTNTIAGPITVAADSRIGATAGALTLSNTINLAAAATAETILTFNPAASTSITASGQISDGLNTTYGIHVTQIGNGTLTLSNATNNYYGNTTIGTAGGTTTGTLALGASGALPTVNTASAVAIYSGTLALSNFNATAYGTLALGGGGAGSTAAVTTGTGTLTLGGNVTYDATNNPNGATIAGNLALGANRTFTIGDSTAAANDLSVSAIVSGTGFGINKQGAGELVLSGANTYTGVTTVTAGSLRATTSTQALGTGAATVSLAGGTLELANDTALNFGRNTTVTTTGSTIVSDRITAGAGVTQTLGTLSIGAQQLNITAGTNVTSGTAGVTFGATALTGNAGLSVGSGAQLTLGALGDGGTARTLTKTGAGTLNLSAAASTWTTNNNVVVNAGTLQLGASNALGASALSNITVNATTAGTTALFDLNGNNQSILSLTFGGAGGTSTSTNNVSTGAGTLTLGGNVTYNATGNPLGSTLSGNLALGANRTFTVNDSTNAANDLTVSAVVSGGGFGITKAGAGTMVLSGANTYTGITTVNAGTLKVSADNNLGTAPGAPVANSLTLGGGTLEATAGFTLNSNRGVTLTAATNSNITADTGQTLTSGGVITGSGNIAYGTAATGTGTVSLSGASTYSGTTTVNAGTLNIQNNTALGTSAGGTTVNSGAALEIQNNITVTGEALTLNGTGVSSGGALRNVSGNNAWVGDITLGSASTISVASGQLQTSNASRGNVINLNGNTVTFTGDGYAMLYSQVGATGSDIGSLVMNGGATDGSGTVRLRGLYNTYTGSTTINNGTLILDTIVSYPNQGILGTTVNIGNGTGAADSAVLQLGSGTAAYELINDAATITINKDGLFNLNGQYETIAGLNLTGGHVSIGTGAGTLYLSGNATTNASSQTALIEGYQFSLSSGTRTFNVAAGTTPSGVDLEVSAKTFNGGIVKSGAGTMVLSGDNSFGGTTTVNAGVLNLRHSNALGQADGTAGTGTTVASGAALQVQGNIAIGTVSNQEKLTISGDGVTAGTGALRNISGSNSWTGPVNLGAAARINSDSGTLTMNGSVDNGGATLTVGGAGNTSMTGAMSGTGGLTKDGNGTLTLSSTGNNYGGATLISAGTLFLGASGVLPNATAVTVAASGTLNLNSNTETVASIAGSGSIVIGTGQLIAGDATNTVFSGTMTGTGTFTKQGAGQLTFGGNIDSGNSFAGGTVALNAGSLLFSASNGDAAVAGNNFNLSISATTNPTLKLSNANVYLNNLTMTGTGTITIDFGGAASILSVLGTLNIGAGVQVTITNWQNAVDYWFAQNWTGAIMDTRGSAPMNQITFNPPTWTNNNTQWQSYDHQVTPVPEPSTYGAALLALMSGLAFWRRFRRSQPR